MAHARVVQSICGNPDVRKGYAQVAETVFGAKPNVVDSGVKKSVSLAANVQNINQTS